MTGFKKLDHALVWRFWFRVRLYIMYAVHVLYLNVQCFDVTRKRARNENKSAKTVLDFFL